VVVCVQPPPAPADAAAIEVGLQIVEQSGQGDVTLVGISAEPGIEHLRRGLSMGAARAMVVADRALSGADHGTTARVLAAAISRLPFDLVVTGCDLRDESSGSVPSEVARLLDLPALTFAGSCAWKGGSVWVRRRLGWADELVESRLPALVGVTAAAARPRRPRLQSVLAVAQTPAEHVELAALGLADIRAPGRSAPMVATRPILGRVGGGGIQREDELSGELMAGLLTARLPRHALQPHRRIKAVGRLAVAPEERSLDQAVIVLGGGRGLGAGGFGLLREVAGLVGGAIGATSIAVDAGWAPASSLVGQSGQTVSPHVYVACGISGALQHICGLRGARHLFAINRDPSAPVFRIAEVGIVGDASAILEKLLIELRSRAANCTVGGAGSSGDETPAGW